MQIHLNIGRLDELFVVDECWAGGLISRLTDPDCEPNMVSASESTIAPESVNYCSLDKDGVRNHRRRGYLIQLKLSVVCRSHAPLDTSFQSNHHDDQKLQLGGTKQASTIYITLTRKSASAK